MTGNLDRRITTLEEAARPRLAEALGGTCVVEVLPDGRTRLHDGRAVTPERGTGGHHRAMWRRARAGFVAGHQW